MSKEFDALAAQVTNIKDVGDSIIATLAGVKAKLDAAIAAGADPAALQALSDSLASEAQKMSDAIVAGTPAA